MRSWLVLRVFIVAGYEGGGAETGFGTSRGRETGGGGWSGGTRLSRMAGGGRRGRR